MIKFFRNLFIAIGFHIEYYLQSIFTLEEPKNGKL